MQKIGILGSLPPLDRLQHTGIRQLHQNHPIKDGPFLPFTSDVTLQCSIHQSCYSKHCANFLLSELLQSDNSIETPYVCGRINSIEIRRCRKHFHFLNTI